MVWMGIQSIRYPILMHLDQYMQSEEGAFAAEIRKRWIACTYTKVNGG